MILSQCSANPPSHISPFPFLFHLSSTQYIPFHTYQAKTSTPTTLNPTTISPAVSILEGRGKGRGTYYARKQH